MRWLLTVVVVLMLATPAAAVPDVPMPIINQDGTVSYQLVPYDQLNAYILDTYGVAVGTVRLPAPSGATSGGVPLGADGWPDYSLLIPTIKPIAPLPGLWDK